MKTAITGGTGFVGRNTARLLLSEGHQVVLISRGQNKTEPGLLNLPNSETAFIGLDDPRQLKDAFAGCETAVHCAGINREIGSQTYQRVHIDGTRHVVHAAKEAGVRKIILISFLRARPKCGSPYHESKWAAEQIVRECGLDYTILKCGVIYGRGDHMLDHLSHAFYTFPLFAFVGFQDQFIRPNAVQDVARIIKAAVVEGALSRQTVPVLGPEQLTLRQAVRRVARVVGRSPLMFPMPVWFHYLLGWVVEKIMTVPLVSTSQVRMLSEGLAEPTPPFASMPSDLAPKIHFTEEQIRNGLPNPGPFQLDDIRCCSHMHALGSILVLPINFANRWVSGKIHHRDWKNRVDPGWPWIPGVFPVLCNLRFSIPHRRSRPAIFSAPHRNHQPPPGNCAFNRISFRGFHFLQRGHWIVCLWRCRRWQK